MLAQNPADKAKKQISAEKEAILDQAEQLAKNAAAASRKNQSAKAKLIRERIKALHIQQAEYLKKIASGELKPNADLLKKWPKIQEDVFSVRKLIGALNKLDADDPGRPALESKIFGVLQQVGIYLVAADHPAYTPRKLDGFDRAEMSRIEKTIENIEYGDRSKAKPVEVIGMEPIFTLVQLPVPLVLKSKPGEKIYLVADTGGEFANGLSLTELHADKDGIAKTTWVSIGEAVGICKISIFSSIAIERQEIQIQVVSPHLSVIDGLPKPDKALLLPTSKISRKTVPDSQ